VTGSIVASSPEETAMSADRGFEHPVIPPGQETTTTLAELLGLTDDAGATERIRVDLARVRDAEIRAERASAEVRLY
jgi:hypothetical protein